MTDPSDANGELDPALVVWLADVSGAETLTIERRTGGASRAGYAVDAHRADGTTVELWLRTDPGFGPQSATLYSLRREAAVYRALAPTPMRVAELVAVHPDQPAFLMRRVVGESRFAQIQDPAEQLSVAKQFIDQLATLHRLDPVALDLPELGAPNPGTTGAISAHVLTEIDEWERQYETAGGAVPIISLACRWLRARVPADGDWPIVLVQGDTGPGNFMFCGAHLTAVTDWELAHWGDLHDDLAWLMVRDTLERFPDLAARFDDYERASGFSIDHDRLRYFRVLAQFRATIGTLAGLRTRDRRGEIAWQLMYNALHTRLLGEVLAEAEDVALARAPIEGPDDQVDGTMHSWVYDVALGDLRDVVLPALSDDFAQTRAKSVARLVKYLREVDRLGPTFSAVELDEIGELLGRPVATMESARRAVCAAIDDDALTIESVLPYCLRQAARETALMRPAMGALADRHVTALGRSHGAQTHGEAATP